MCGLNQQKYIWNIKSNTGKWHCAYADVLAVAGK